MKKTTHKSRLRIKRDNERARISQTKRQRTLAHLKRLRAQKGLVSSVSITISAPETFEVFEEKKRKLFLSFLAELRRVAKSPGKVVIDFRMTKKISSDGGLLLKSEIFRLKKIFGHKTSFKCLPPANDKIRQVLQKIGVFEDLGYFVDKSLTREDVVHWCYAHGNTIDGEKYEPVLGAYDGIIAEPILRGLYSALSEAMSNSIDHAYRLGIRGDGLNYKDDSNDWWMFSQEYKGQLNVVFCDLGVGIPNTISKQRPVLAELIKRFGIKKDSEVIKFAAGSGKSRTRKGYRGRGLPQMVKIIKAISDGKLAIFSNKGMLRCDNGVLLAKEYRSSILGTLIMWQVPMPEDRK